MWEFCGAMFNVAVMMVIWWSSCRLMLVVVVVVGGGKGVELIAKRLVLIFVI